MSTNHLFLVTDERQAFVGDEPFEIDVVASTRKEARAMLKASGYAVLAAR